MLYGLCSDSPCSHPSGVTSTMWFILRCVGTLFSLANIMSLLLALCHYIGKPTCIFSIREGGGEEERETILYQSTDHLAVVLSSRYTR